MPKRGFERVRRDLSGRRETTCAFRTRRAVTLDELGETTRDERCHSRVNDARCSSRPDSRARDRGDERSGTSNTHTRRRSVKVISGKSRFGRPKRTLSYTICSNLTRFFEFAEDLYFFAYASSVSASTRLSKSAVNTHPPRSPLSRISLSFPFAAFLSTAMSFSNVSTVMHSGTSTGRLNFFSRSRVRRAMLSSVHPSRSDMSAAITIPTETASP